MFNLIIIGGGVSGLMAAYEYSRLNPKKKVLVIEKNNRVGGFCRTTRVSSYVWDRAGHFFHFKDENIKKFFLSKISKNELIFKEKQTGVYDKSNTKVDFPHQNNWRRAYSEVEIEKIEKSYLNRPMEFSSSFEDLVVSRYGQELANLFLLPYNKKLYSCDLNKLDKECMGRFLPPYKPNSFFVEQRDNQMSYNSTFLYPKNGSEVFVQAILDNLPGNVQILTNCSMSGINIEKKEVLTAAGVFGYEKAISTISLKQFVETDTKKRFLKKRKVLKNNKVLVFNIGFDVPRIHNKDWLYFANPEICFYRFGSYANILNQAVESCYVEIGLGEDVWLSFLEIERYFFRAIKELKELGLLHKNANVVEWEYEILDPAYCHITQESDRAVQDIRKQLLPYDVFLVGRYSRWEYCSIEDNIIEAIETVSCL